MKHPLFAILVMSILSLAAFGPPGMAAPPARLATSQLFECHAQIHPVSIDALAFDARHQILTVHTLHVNDAALEVDSICVPATPKLINEGYITHDAEIIEGINLLPYSPLIATFPFGNDLHGSQYNLWSWTIGHWC